MQIDIEVRSLNKIQIRLIDVNPKHHRIRTNFHGFWIDAVTSITGYLQFFLVDEDDKIYLCLLNIYADSRLIDWLMRR